MTPLADALHDPIPLPPNRIGRFYRGGRMLDAFRGLPEPADDDRPEDWVGSATATWAPRGMERGAAGISSIEVGGGRLGLDALLAREPEALIGRPMLERLGPTLGILVKLLDAGQRLPVHCHPTRSAARELLDSPFGKTEAWIVLGVRDDEPAPRVWAGFREAVSKAILRDWIDRGDTRAMLDALDEHVVRPGDAFLIPGGVPHAIGAGIFILELQEPTDFSIVAETHGVPITEEDASLGLGWDRAIDFFRTDPAENLRQLTGTPTDHDGMRLTPLLGAAADPYVRAVRAEVSGEKVRMPLPPSFTVGVVTEGRGAIEGPTRSLPLRRGTTFALPAAAVPEVRLTSEDHLELILCLPPDPSALVGPR